VLDLSWIVATGENEFNHDPFARKHPLYARTAPPPAIEHIAIPALTSSYAI
jgi:hypothetical protein